MIRLVLDTNVLVSALLTPAGLEASVLLLALRGMMVLCVSQEILAEYEDVLYRAKLKLDPARVRQVLSDVRRVATVVRPSMVLAVSKDEPDNRFLECAEAGNADFLVTGNRRHFPGQWKSTKIVNARELLELIEIGG